MILIHSPRPRCQLQRGLRQLKKHSDELQEKVSNLGYDAGVEAYVFISMHAFYIRVRAVLLTLSLNAFGSKKMLGKKFDYVKIRNILQKVRFRAAVSGATWHTIFGYLERRIRSS